MGNFFKEHLNPERGLDLLKAPFEDHGDQPWLQGTLRNMAVAIEGPTMAGENMERFLGDTVVDGQGYRNPSQIPTYDNRGLAVGQPAQGQPPPTDDLQMKALQRFMQSNQ